METLVFWIVVGISAVSLIASAHTFMWTMCTAWHLKGAQIVRTQGINAYRRHQASPPWYIRYSAWLDRRVFRKKEA